MAIEAKEVYRTELRRLGVYLAGASEWVGSAGEAALESWRKHYRGYASKDSAYEYCVSVELGGGESRLYAAALLESDLREKLGRGEGESEGEGEAEMEWREPRAGDLAAIESEPGYCAWLERMSA